MPFDQAAVEAQSSVLDRDRVSWEADDALDQVDVFVGVAEYDDVPALGRMRQYLTAERRKAEWEAKTGKAIGPCGDNQIVPDVERWQHRSRGNVERLHDEAPERPRHNHQEENEARRAPRIFRPWFLPASGGSGRGWRVHVPRLFPRLARPSTRAGNCRGGHYVPAAWRPLDSRGN